MLYQWHGKFAECIRLVTWCYFSSTSSSGKLRPESCTLWSNPIKPPSTLSATLLPKKISKTVWKRRKNNQTHQNPRPAFKTDAAYRHRQPQSAVHHGRRDRQLWVTCWTWCANTTRPVFSTPLRRTTSTVELNYKWRFPWPTIRRNPTPAPDRTLHPSCHNSALTSELSWHEVLCQLETFRRHFSPRHQQHFHQLGRSRSLVFSK